MTRKMNQRKIGWTLAFLLCLLWSGFNCTPEDTGSEKNAEVTTPKDSGATTDTVQTDQGSPETKPADTGSKDTDTADDAPSDATVADTTAPDRGKDAGTTDTKTPDTTPERAPDSPPVPDKPPVTGNRLLYVAQTKAINAFRLDVAAGKLTRTASFSLSSGAVRFLAFHPTKPYIYAANQNRVDAYTIQQQTGAGAIKALGSMRSGENGTHLDVDNTGKYVFVASYGGNQVSMLPLGVDGKPKAPTFQRGGKNNKTFCQKAHQVRVHPDNRFVYVPCLGSDHILVLNFDATTGKVTPTPVAKTPAGSGPRHLDFHPNKRWLYVINETKSSVIGFRINAKTGALTQFQEITSLPQGITQGSRSSDIHVSPDGKFVFAVNREPLNNVAMFSVASDGKLTAAGHVSTGGVHARTFTFGPNGRYLYIGNTRSKQLVVLKRDANNKWTKLSSLNLPLEIWFVGILP